MEESIEAQAEREAKEIWEKKLKNDFDEHINKCLMETLRELKNHLNIFDETMKTHMNELDQKFKKKFEEQISSLKQQSNINQNITNPFSQFNNNNINNNENMIETDDILRKREINLNEINEPSLKMLRLSINSNPLINLILYCLVNFKNILLYYFNSSKEEKILKKESGIKNVFGPAFLKLIDHYWKSKKNEYAPNDIHLILKNLIKNNYMTQNPGLIFENILCILNSELEQNSINLAYDFNSPTSYNLPNVWNYFSQIYIKNPTKIKNSIYSIIQTEKMCTLCKYIQYSFKNGPIINLYLQANPNAIHNNIYLINNIEKLLISPNESIINEYCLNCKTNKRKKISNYILNGSEIIIFNINRDSDPNNLVQLNYPNQLSSDDIINAQKNFLAVKKYRYDLSGIIRKVKINNNSIFILHCKNPINNKWYTYDNNNITPEINIPFASQNVYLLVYQISNQFK